MDKIRVRYIVNDVQVSIKFYTQSLGFKLDFNPSPGYAVVSKGVLELLLNTKDGGGGTAQQMRDGSTPEPGGWNRIQIVVDDLEMEVTRLRESGAQFRNEIVIGNGGAQILLVDPSGNPIELFQLKKK